jgi:protein involved in polysaccharide export with SLBB domain
MRFFLKIKLNSKMTGLDTFSTLSKFKSFLLMIVFSLFFLGAQGQSLSDIQNIKVDNLSDAQLEQMLKKAEENGINPNQLEAMARERGMPASEASKLKKRISELRKSGMKNTTDSKSEVSNQSRSVTGYEEVDMFDSLRKSDPYYDLTTNQKKIFGYKLFHNKNLDFSPNLNLPTPQSYIVGPGDQLLVDVYGYSEQSFDLSVSPDGVVFVPNVGPIKVGGASIAAASSRMKDALGKIYSGLLGFNPNTFLQVRLGNIRSIKVSLVGELLKPGTYTLPSFSSVFNALFAAGGPNENGAFRNIQVYRDSKLLTTVDIYEFLMKGEQKSNVTLQDNDVIIVPTYQTRVEVLGPVRREGLFEVKQGETLQDLYVYAGGFNPNAYKERVTVRRLDKNQRKILDVPQPEYSSFFPSDGDEILIGEALDRFSNRVQISGAINRPGEYSLEESGLTVKGLLEKAAGLKPDAFLTRATLYRTSFDLTLAAESLNLQGILEGSSVDIELKNEDLLFIPSRYDIQEEYYVKISGEINSPGSYPFGSSMTVGDLILRAGGLLESASSSSIEIASRVRDASSGSLAEITTINIDASLQLTDLEKSKQLLPFDHVFIRKSPGFEREQLVDVKGEVMYPGEFAISNANERISDVIKRAGGLTPFAYPKGANLIRKTIYFKGLSDQELKEKTWREIKTNLDPEKNRNVNEAESRLYERIDKKIEVSEEKKRKEEEEAIKLKFLNNDDVDFSKTFLKDSTFNQVRMKEEDLVGIDLEAILKNPGSKEDLILLEGDVLQIPKQLQTVRMVGEVLLPTTSRFVERSSVRDYISKAGGFTDEARRSKIYVVYANGDAKSTRSFLGIKSFPNIEPGSEIIIPKKPFKQQMGVAAWVGLGSSLATLGILVNTLINQ